MWLGDTLYKRAVENPRSTEIQASEFRFSRLPGSLIRERGSLFIRSFTLRIGENYPGAVIEQLKIYPFMIADWNILSVAVVKGIRKIRNNPSKAIVTVRLWRSELVNEDSHRLLYRGPCLSARHAPQPTEYTIS
uniref:Uncharacterized protein n=1 Tax=Coccidioides posadasii RMSCC 3488 TaxID=454284 RepID=A0A0J6EXP6_COCPO|nr:hypothetical protein CPAG_01682 [Coccidioides posadasii RMSCC 3488]